MFVCLYVLCLCGCGVLYVHCVCCVWVVCMCVCCPAPLINKLQRVISQADGLPSHPFLSLSYLCLPFSPQIIEGYPSFLFQIGLLDEQEKKYFQKQCNDCVKFIHQEKWLQAFEVSSGSHAALEQEAPSEKVLEARGAWPGVLLLEKLYPGCCHRSGGETSRLIRKKRTIWVSLNLLWQYFKPEITSGCLYNCVFH